MLCKNSLFYYFITIALAPLGSFFIYVLIYYEFFYITLILLKNKIYNYKIVWSVYTSSNKVENVVSEILEMKLVMFNWQTAF